MWIVESKIFESHREAQEHASKLNKSRALIEQIEVSELLDPIKPTRIVHFQGSWENLCGARFQGSVHTIFPDKVDCPTCLEMLEAEDKYDY